MARAGEEIHNPVQGDWIVFRETARDTGGKLMSGELVVAPSGGNPLHVHPLQEEHFEILSGTLDVQIGDEHLSLGEGEEATVPPGTPHRWFNESDREEVRVLGEVRPALNSEVFFETLYGLARDGRTDESGVPNPLQFAVMLNGLHKGEIYLAEPPVALQKALFALLSVRQVGWVQRPLPQIQRAEDPERRGSGPTVHDERDGESTSHGGRAGGGIVVLDR
jgi:quercetin dioxygenase-like cupin family protein